MNNNENLNEAEIENEANLQEKDCKKEEIINLDASDNSDIEIVKVRRIVTFRKRKPVLKDTLQSPGNAISSLNSTNCLLKNEQESFIKEEIIISDGSDSDDANQSKNMKIVKKRTFSNCNINGFGNIRKRPRRIQKEYLSSITLNCPRCNKTKTLFSTTIKTTCKECNVNMSYVCDKCTLRYESLPALYRHLKIQCRSILPTGQILTPLKTFIRKCAKCRGIQQLWQTRKYKRCRKCKINMCFECVICSKNYISYSGLYVHAKLQCQAPLKTYYCSDCSFKCTSQGVLARHINTSHIDPHLVNLRCKKCSKICPDALRLRAHILSCGINFYYCKFCSYKYKFQDNLKKHLLSCHRDAVQIESLDNIVEEVTSKKLKSKATKLARIDDEKEDLQRMKKLHCPECKTSVPHVSGLYTCSNCKSEYHYECSVCGKIFKGRSSIYRHTRRMHAKLKYSCKNCNKLFSFYGDMSEHYKSCGKEPQYECNICYFKTRYKYNLTCHLQKLHNENRRSFTCADCGIEYKTNKSLERHMIIGCK